MGQELERIDYLDLFNVIRYTWGRGEGTKFKLPDLRGLFLRGAGQNSENEFHYKQGKNYTVGKMQLDTMKSHDHNVIDNGHFHKIKLGTTATHNDGGCAPKFADCNKGFHPTSELTKSNTQIQESKANIQIERQGSEESRPKNAAVNFLIKFK
jgi:microcystin-dependent protein